MSSNFKIKSSYKPKGDQPLAIKTLARNIKEDQRFQTLLGATGTGKTFTVAQIIQQVQKPTLVMSPNKTLCAQLYNEFKELFPENAVHYFVSYYDYYQPEKTESSRSVSGSIYACIWDVYRKRFQCERGNRKITFGCNSCNQDSK